MVGHEFHGGRLAVAWNQQVFNNTNASLTSGHAATIHIYTVVNAVGIVAANLEVRAPELLSSAWQFPLAQHGFLENTIPSRHRIWITEMGHRARRAWPTPEIDGTWLEASTPELQPTSCCATAGWTWRFLTAWPVEIRTLLRSQLTLAQPLRRIAATTIGR
jgi:hypothetical protein